MKRTLISMAVGAACAITSVATLAADAPTVYGRLDLSLQTVDKETDGTDQWEVTSYASRLGFKGSAELNESMKAIYTYETQIDPDMSGPGILKARNQYVGIESSNIGTVLIGRIDSPLKQAQGNVDKFDNHAADIANMLIVGENRISSVVEYVSPKIADAVTVKVALKPGEGVDVDQDGKNDDGIADSASLSAAYSADGLYLALAYDSNITNGYDFDDDGSVGSGEEFGADLLRLVGTYQLDDLSVGILYQDGESANETTEINSFVLSGAYSIGENTLKAQYGQTELEVGGVVAVELDMIALGVEHKLAKSTMVYAEYTGITTEVGSTSQDDTTISFGVQHKF